MTISISALAAHPPARSWRVLIVDDHEASRLGTCHVLALCGHVCFTAGTAPAAMDAIDVFRPEAVVLEWKLAGGAGRGLTHALRTKAAASSRKLVVLVVSTSDEPDGFRERELVDAYFTKPISMIRIAEMLVALDDDFSLRCYTHPIDHLRSANSRHCDRTADGSPVPRLSPIVRYHQSIDEVE